MSNRKEITNWVKSKTKTELVKVAVELIQDGILSENVSFNKFPYCPHSGETFLDSDEWEED